MKKISILLPLLLLLMGGCSGQTEIQASAAPETEAQTLYIEPEVTEMTEDVQTFAAPDPVAELLGTMTLEEKVGQLFLGRCPENTGVQDVEQYHLGGYILFGIDFDGQTPDSLRRNLNAYQEASRIPLLIAVDEEGGTVCRVSSQPAFRSEKFPSPRQLYARGGMELVLGTEWEKAFLLSGLGINVNMAPVCDIARTPGAFMYDRSLGESPEVTAEFVSGAIGRMADCHVGGVMKHFPGYGENADTHTGIAVDERPLSQLESTDLVPFRAGIEAGCGAILVSHTIVQALDPDYPASLSGPVHDYLREEMGFGGVIVTDDMAMQAITNRYGKEESAVLAVLAGNDLICTTYYRAQFDAVLAAVRDGRIPEAVIDTAAERVLRWKYALGLIPDDLWRTDLVG